MKHTRLPIAGVLLGLVCLAACRGSSGNNPEPDGPGGGSGSDGSVSVVHIQDVQNAALAAGAAVEVHGVVVTAIDAYGNRTGDFWVEEPDGGPFSGVHVFGAPVSQIANLTVGDVVDISGAIKSEFAISGDTSGRSITELQAPMGGTLTVTKQGTGTVPAPTVVDALAIGQKPTQAERDAEWEKWEGVLITVNNIAEFNLAACITSQGVCTDPTFQKFNVTGGLVVESSLAAMPSSGLAVDACLASVTGLVDYAFDYLIYPRTTSDIVLGGAACPVKENTPELCGNGIDDDGNGFKDCAENACVLPLQACHPATTISAIQAATPTGAIELQNVFVMGLSNDKKSLWVSTTPTAAPGEGVFIFRGPNSAVLDAAVVPGAMVNVIGTVTEFNDDGMGGSLTEVNRLQVTVVAAPTTAPVPVTGQDAAALLLTTNAAAYESVLVMLNDVKLTAIGNADNGFVATAVQGTTTFGVGTDILRLAAGNLGCYSSITGFWTNLEAGASSARTKPNAYGFIPLTLGTSVTCPP